MSLGESTLASNLFDHNLRDVQDRTEPVFGVAVHQSGSSIVEAALEEGADPLEFAVDYYLKPDSYFAHYVIGHNGEIAQVADEREKASHIGFDKADRVAFLTGKWKKMLPASFVDMWMTAWPGVKSPSHLFPGASPNNVYVGVEMLPIVKGIEWQPADWLKDGRFTEQQHLALIELCLDIAQRQKLPLMWMEGERLVTHEDVNPLQRTTKKPAAGWDPGWLRANPWFDMGFVRRRVKERTLGLDTSDP